MGQSSMQRRYQIIKVEGCILGQKSEKPTTGRCPYCGMPKKSMIKENKLIEKVEDINAYLTELRDDKNQSDKRNPREKENLNQVITEVNTLKDFLNQSEEHYYMLSHGQSNTEDKSKCEEGYFKIKEDENDPLEIVFQRLETGSTIPQEHEAFFKAIANANTIVKGLEYTDEEVKKHYIKELGSIANIGLGKKKDAKLATESLDIIKNEIVRKEGTRIKNKYMLELGKKAIMLGIIAIAGLAFQNYITTFMYSAYLCVWIGAMIGAWTSFGIRRMSIEFEQLDVIEKDMMDTWIRLIFVGSISIIIFMFIKASIITFDIGGFKSADMISNTEFQIMLGILCGLIESKLGLGVYSKAESMFSDDKEKSG